MKIELNNTEIAEIISKYTETLYDENDVLSGTITEGAVYEAILCSYDVIHKEDMVGQSWSWYEKLQKQNNLEVREVTK